MTKDSEGCSKRTVEVKLEDLIDILDSERIPVNSKERNKRAGNIPYYGATGQVGWIDDYIFDEELVLLGEDGAPFFDSSKDVTYLITGKSWVNNHAHVLKAIDGLSSNEYLKHFLNQFDFTGYVGGSTRLKLTQRDLRRIPVKLFSIDEQHRIVQKLDQLLPKVESCKERLEKIPAILKRFRQSVLAAACSGRLTEDWRREHLEASSEASKLKQQILDENTNKRGNSKKNKETKRPNIPAPDTWDYPNEWEQMLSFDVLSFVTSGSRGWAKYYSDEGAIFLRIGNLDHDTIDLDLSSIQRVSPPSGAEGTRTKVEENDILISITADVGMIGLVPTAFEEAYINQHISLARPVKAINPKYLAMYFSSLTGGQEQFRALQRGATKSGLGLDDIRSIWLPLPSLEEQLEIVNRVELLFAKFEQISSMYEASFDYVLKLSDSILAKAFRGELVPQDPKDEPASVLLERIKAEREKFGKSKKQSRKKSDKSRRSKKSQDSIDFHECNNGH